MTRIPHFPTAGVAVLAFATPFLYHLISLCVSTTAKPIIQALVNWPSSLPVGNATAILESGKRAAAEGGGGHVSSSFVCDPQHAYTTEIISLDPLLIYIHNFLSDDEIAALLAAGEPAFAPSEVIKPNGHQQQQKKQTTTDRTSQSAGLELSNPAVACVLARARRFMTGGLLDPAEHGDEMGPPQLVRYGAGQRFNLHHDWFERPQPARREHWARFPGLRSWNRLASFFAVLEDGCTGGETHFPYVKPLRSRREVTGKMAEGEDEARSAVWFERDEAEGGGGVAFRPVKGNALFWVNLHANGTGDERTMHAGLPLGEGRKTAMNIWPRQYYW